MNCHVRSVGRTIGHSGVMAVGGLRGVACGRYYHDSTTVVVRSTKKSSTGRGLEEPTAALYIVTTDIVLQLEVTASTAADTFLDASARSPQRHFHPLDLHIRISLGAGGGGLRPRLASIRQRPLRRR